MHNTNTFTIIRAYNSTVPAKISNGTVNPPIANPTITRILINVENVVAVAVTNPNIHNMIVVVNNTGQRPHRSAIGPNTNEPMTSPIKTELKIVAA
jgi:hypothetical protein